MNKKYRHLVLISFICMFLFVITGCEGIKNKSLSLQNENSKGSSFSLQNIVNLSVSNISSIGTSYGGGKPTRIENTKQKEEICSFLSRITLSQKYETEPLPYHTSGGGGACFVIIYNDNTTSDIHIYEDDKNIKITGITKDGTLKDKFRVYTISDLSQTKKLNEILSMKPAN